MWQGCVSCVCVCPSVCPFVRLSVWQSSGLGPGVADRQFGLIDSWDNVIIDNCVSCETDLLLLLLRL